MSTRSRSRPGTNPSIPSRPRSMTGRLMAVVAVSGVFLAALAYSLTGEHLIILTSSYLLSYAGVLVLLYNFRLSGWLWVAAVGYAGPPLFGLALSIASTMWPSLPGVTIVAVHFFLNGTFSLLFVVGLAMAFRDIRRRLADREGGS